MSFADLSWRDAADIILVAIVIYNLLLLIRGTRGIQILLGILFLGGIYWTAGYIGLPTLQKLLGNFIFFLPMVVIILFQAEIRQALASFWRSPIFSFGTNEEIDTTINEVVVAATTLASRRIGALIVIQRLEGLRNYVENGIEIDARISYDLLINIFSPETPLHDGAAIIQGERIAAAACFLPLTLRHELSKEFGTRHRAALGISEETDALAVVASEETGAVSVALGGEMQVGLDAKTLRNVLYRYLVTDQNAALEGTA
jgi:diadenylate cyclase